ncbi:TPA: hypothetical protein ACG0BA_004805, partial [Serratia odorifera]
MGGKSSYVVAISKDGKRVIGNSETSTPEHHHAFMWESGKGIKEIGIANPDFLAITASEDGNVVLGRDDHNQLLLWNSDQADAFTPIIFPGFAAPINDHSIFLSGNGKVVAGYLMPEIGPKKFFWWTAEKGVNFISPPSKEYIDSYLPAGISFDGNVVFGKVVGVNKHFRWTMPNYEDCQEEQGCIETFAHDDGISQIFSVSKNGKTAVGVAVPGNQSTTGFRLTKEGGVEYLVKPSYLTVVDANLVSSNGQVIVGFGSSKTETKIRHLVRWTEEGEAQDLGSVPSSYMLEFPRSMSDDGKSFAFTASNEVGSTSLFKWTENACPENTNTGYHGCLKDLGKVAGT